VAPRRARGRLGGHFRLNHLQQARQAAAGAEAALPATDQRNGGLGDRMQGVDQQIVGLIIALAVLLLIALICFSRLARPKASSQMISPFLTTAREREGTFFSSIRPTIFSLTSEKGPVRSCECPFRATEVNRVRHPVAARNMGR